MPALDAARERVSRNGWRTMGRQPAAANSRDRALGVCIRDFAEHALRRRGDVAWLSRACGRDFFCWISSMAASGGYGVLPAILLSHSTNRGSASFLAIEHDQRGVFRHS